MSIRSVAEGEQAVVVIARPAPAARLPDLRCPALWLKNFSDARLLLALLTLLLLIFPWIFVWVSGKVGLPALSTFLANAIPKQWERLSPVPFKDVATEAGRIALVYVHPVIVFSAGAWAIARGSDIVSGELNRGTLEMILAQPISRVAVYVVQASVTTFGALLLALATYISTCLGLWNFPPHSPVPWVWYLQPALNLAAFTFCLAGITSLFSALDSYRWRTIGLACGMFLVALIVKLVARLSAPLEWLAYLSFLTPFEPQALVGGADHLAIAARYNLVLVILGLATYVTGGVIFSRRNLPAPL